MWYDGNKVIIIKLIVVVVGSFCFQGMFSDCIKVIIIKQFEWALIYFARQKVFMTNP